MNWLTKIVVRWAVRRWALNHESMASLDPATLTRVKIRMRNWDIQRKSWGRRGPRAKTLKTGETS